VGTSADDPSQVPAEMIDDLLKHASSSVDPEPAESIIADQNTRQIQIKTARDIRNPCFLMTTLPSASDMSVIEKYSTVMI
jgi:hypothetical protein